MQIRNWKVESDRITWTGNSQKLSIMYNEIFTNGSNTSWNPFDLIMHTCAKDFVSEEDIYALNTAVLYAIQLYKLEIQSNIDFINLIVEQQRIIEEKNRNQNESDEITIGN